LTTQVNRKKKRNLNFKRKELLITLKIKDIDFLVKCIHINLFYLTLR